MRTFKSLLAVATVIGGALMPLAAKAQVNERTFRYATQSNTDHPLYLGAVRFGEILKAKSGGKLNLRLFGGGQLGGDLQNASALQGGTLDFTSMNAGLLVGIHKPFALLDLPFLFNSPEEADKLVDGPIGKKLFDELPSKGLVGLSYWELGLRHVTNSKRPITKLEDFAALKLRVLQSPLFIDVFNGLGANAIPMAWPEVYPALEQKVVDGQENPHTQILGAKIFEVQKFCSNTGHIYNVQSFLISKKTWDSLTSDEKKLISEAADEATIYQRKTSREAGAVAADTLRKNGMVINDLAPAEIARIREKVKPVVEKFANDTDASLYKDILAALAQIRK